MEKKIAILTLPLGNNYGAILQNYALQLLIKKFKATPITIDYVVSEPPFWKVLFSWLKTIVYKCFGKKRKFIKKFREKRKKIFSEFILKNIKKTPLLQNLKSVIKYDSFFAIIVGSDQVWRPLYSCRIRDMFLDFCTNENDLKRIAYAASFGVDNWEYSSKQTCKCSKLAKQFDAISVREESGVKLCKEHLGVEATWVLDPTLLLAKEDYLPLCEEVPVCNEKYLAVYVLDENEQVMSIYEKEAKSRGLVLKKFYADSKSTLTVPQWLAMFRDASYVVTDSFHGTVFSILFGKEFRCIYNKDRGLARFESLLNLYNAGKLDEMREFSINWLKNSLNDTKQNLQSTKE